MKSFYQENKGFAFQHSIEPKKPDVLKWLQVKLKGKPGWQVVWSFCLVINSDGRCWFVKETDRNDSNNCLWIESAKSNQIKRMN